MGEFVIRQPNGLLCRFSSIVDCPTHYNITEEEYIEMCVEKAREEARDVLKNHLKPFEWLREWFIPNNMTEEEFEQILSEMSKEREGAGANYNVELTMQRDKIESEEKWIEISSKIPPLNFKKEWNVKVIPPFSGALARFTVEYNGNYVSVYLDWYGRLGCVDGPYWELCSSKTGTIRYLLCATEELMKDIETILESECDVN